MSSSPLNCWLPVRPNRVKRRHLRRNVEPTTKINVERLERREVPTMLGGFGFDQFNSGLFATCTTNNNTDCSTGWTNSGGWSQGGSGCNQGGSWNFQTVCSNRHTLSCDHVDFHNSCSDSCTPSTPTPCPPPPCPPPPPPPCPPPANNTVSGTVFEDCNNNGVQDTSETAISGVTMTLSGTLADGSSFSSVSTTTDASGNYSFGNLAAGTYSINESKPSGFFDGIDTPGTPFGGTAGTESISNVVIPTGTSQNGTGYNFGNVDPSSLAGTVYNDVNSNGTQDTGEAGVSGVHLTLTGTDNQGNAVTVSTTSGTDGSYSFGNLAIGNYAITEVQPTGFVSTNSTAGTINGVATGTPNGATITNINVAGCASGVGFNFGVVTPPTNSISGTVYGDCNNNGVQDSGETGITGTTVTLSGTLADGTSVSAMSTTTDANGSYQFSNLAAGTYTVAETEPAGFYGGKDTAGAPFGGTAGTDAITNVMIPTGASQNGTGYNFGNIAPTTIAGTVFNDANANGVQDTQETGLGGVQMVLTGTDNISGAVNLTTTTAADGSYSFGNLRLGQYTVIEAPPAGYKTTMNTVGTVNGVASGTIAGSAVVGINIAGCAGGIGYNFGNNKPPVCPPVCPPPVTPPVCPPPVCMPPVTPPVCPPPVTPPVCMPPVTPPVTPPVCPPPVTPPVCPPPVTHGCDHHHHHHHHHHWTECPPPVCQPPQVPPPVTPPISPPPVVPPPVVPPVCPPPVCHPPVTPPVCPPPVVPPCPPPPPPPNLIPSKQWFLASYCLTNEPIVFSAVA